MSMFIGFRCLACDERWCDCKIERVSLPPRERPAGPTSTTTLSEVLQRLYGDDNGND